MKVKKYPKEIGKDKIEEFLTSLSIKNIIVFSTQN